ncbi:ankyrin repeat domain-containing protein [Puniceicoccus vermicola]|uniref:Ankyrin repeat domain-containing protein n=1 Tax=Puniceicoccus vermicola TaxID=388746 RepID=A0A7X1AZV1_9BACT|nr:ankyrin repeat domain-containing protein [Puniceicoccus vermicola]MBC2602982.1 ankyrin repeat domain-containing protein [Puniceicoccus vermicola]
MIRKPSVRSHSARPPHFKGFAKILFAVVASLSPICLTAESNLPSPRQVHIDFLEGIMSGDIAAMQRAFAAGATLEDASEFGGKPPISYAIQYNQIEALRWLLENGADVETFCYSPNPQDSLLNRVSPLTLAITLQRQEIIQELLRQDASIKAIEGSTRSPAHAALAVGGPQLLQQLEQLGVNWKAPLSDRRHPLMWAILNNNVEAIEFLVDGIADPNAPLNNGNFPLAEAAAIGNPDALHVLLDHGADPNAVSKNKPMIRYAQPLPHTALINAIRRNSQACVEVLLQAGADPQALDNAAIKWADLLGHQNIYELLLKNGAPKPAPYAFLDLPQFRGVERASARRKSSSANRPLLSAITRTPEGSPLTPEEPVTLAVITRSDGTEEVAELLGVGLSEVPGINLVEREELRLLNREQVISKSTFFDPSTAARSGQLEGADAAVFLTRTADAIELRTVAASSGLVLHNTTLSTSAFNEETVQQLVRSVAHATHRLSDDLSEQLLVSLPNLIPSRSTPEGDRLTRRISSGLAMVLGAQPNLHVLDRSELQRLSLEKGLNSDVAEFFQSGLVIDGGLEFAVDGTDSLILNLRARSLDGTEIASTSTPGLMSGPSKLVIEATSSLLTQLRNTDPVVTGDTSEASAYFAQARTAFDSHIWSEAHALLQAAEGLGQTGDDFLKFRILTICKLFQSDLRNVQRWQNETGKSELDILVRCAPLEFLPDPFISRQSGDYLELALELLDLSAPIIYSDKKPTPTEQIFWGYLPEVFESANTPLELMLSLSDQQAYPEEIAELRSKLLHQTEVVIQKAEDWQFTQVYCRLILLRARLLRYWITDENEVIEQTLQTVAEAHELAPPYILHTLINEIVGEGYLFYFPRLIGSRISTFNGRLAAALATSDYPHARWQGATKMLKWDRGFKNHLRWTEIIADFFDELYVYDPSPEGLLLFDEPYLLQSADYDASKPPRSDEPWYQHPPDTMHHYQPIFYHVHPDPDSNRSKEVYAPIAQEWLIDLETKRLEFLAKNGAGPFSTLVSSRNLPYSERDPDMLSEQLELAETALQQFSPQNSDSSKRWATASFERRAVKPRREALAPDTPLTRLPITTVAGFLPEHIEPFRGLAVLDKNKSLSMNRKSGGNQNIWITLRRGGFFEISPQGTVARSLRFPGGNQRGILFAADDQYLIASFNHPESGINEVSAYNFASKSWKILTKEEKIPHAVTLHGDFALFIFIRSPKSADSMVKEENTTYSLELINLTTNERHVLISSRRVPPQSPLDNDYLKILGRPPVLLSDHELFIENFVYHLQAHTWRKSSNEERQKVKILRTPTHLWNLEPWLGSPQTPIHNPNTGLWKFPVRISEPTIHERTGKLFWDSKMYDIDVPVHRIILPGGIPGLSEAEVATLTAPGSLHYETVPQGLLAFNDRIVALIPKETLLPHILQRLEDLNVPKKDDAPRQPTATSTSR